MRVSRGWHKLVVDSDALRNIRILASIEKTRRSSDKDPRPDPPVKNAQIPVYEAESACGLLTTVNYSGQTDKQCIATRAESSSVGTLVSVRTLQSKTGD